nr:hypothetical protein [Gammaproteobacteria bacterium]
MAADPTSTVAATGLLQNAADLKAFQRRLRHDGAAGAIQGAYLHGAQRHTPLGDIHGRHNLIAADLRDLAVFDGQRLAQDAAHAGATGASRQQMAWRAEISATHAGTSTLGPASGRELRFRALSVHLLTRGRVYREWQLRDHLAIANQLGLELHAIAHEMAAAERPVPRFLPDFGEIRHGLGQKPPPAEGIDVDGADDIAR